VSVLTAAEGSAQAAAYALTLCIGSQPNLRCRTLERPPDRAELLALDDGHIHFIMTLSDSRREVIEAEERSFTRAAAKLGISQSALSHTVRRLETRLGLRLLNRRTRSVSPTEGGERLLHTLTPAFDQIETELDRVGELRDKPAGTIRITANDHAADTILWPAIAELLPKYPDIKVEIDIDYGLTDIVAGRYDAGVRLGDQVAKDMIAVRIGPDPSMAVVGAPSYFAARPAAKSPRELVNHNCINFRQPSAGGPYA
jgi:DNA-binding transcriptional LysR family regulator